ncbi:hypothetical protein L208DRAFT_1381377 [Tricholoma matsutake]|nr:hypothetical protein L208DRAFT_1381377 [Tricholoma matsutake 945]
MSKLSIVAAGQVPSCQRGLLSPTSSSAIANIFAQWAFVNLLLFSLPFIIGILLLKLSPHIIDDVSNMNDLAIGLPLIVFYASTYVIFMGITIFCGRSCITSAIDHTGHSHLSGKCGQSVGPNISPYSSWVPGNPLFRWYLQEIKLLPLKDDPASIQLCTMSQLPKIFQGLSTIGEYGLSAFLHLQLHVMMFGGSSEATDQCALQSDGTLKDASDIVWYNDKDDDMPIASTSTVQTDMPYTSTSSESDDTITEIMPDEIADMLPLKTKPLKSQKSSKGKGKAKASSNKPSAAKKPCHKIDAARNGAPDGGLSQALPLQGSALSNSFEGSSSSRKKVYSFWIDFVLL